MTHSELIVEILRRIEAVLADGNQVDGVIVGLDDYYTLMVNMPYENGLPKPKLFGYPVTRVDWAYPGEIFIAETECFHTLYDPIGDLTFSTNTGGFSWNGTVATNMTWSGLTFEEIK